ncbi:hypothetical protein D9756_004517 [Leucocoprinus leucothites]|uniref:Uncharacterized protein n=1 Tax=Leucocoprinus leucothites TaxID=201217 RepID=A0A8H5G8U0_9AGAR|nr:hypothetical protein D9756_004517 [Leucoagaricus leucothites]
MQLKLAAFYLFAILTVAQAIPVEQDTATATDAESADRTGLQLSEIV